MLVKHLFRDQVKKLDFSMPSSIAAVGGPGEVLEEKMIDTGEEVENVTLEPLTEAQMAEKKSRRASE